MAANRAGASSYLYLFDHTPGVPLAKPLGAFHGAEVPYVFGNSALGLDVTKGADGEVSRAVMTYWTRFAASGDPNVAGLPEWPRYDPRSDEWLVIDQPTAARAHVFERGCDLADALRARRLGASQ
jgi:para-nitrobenzyl esterase